MNKLIILLAGIIFVLIGMFGGVLPKLLLILLGFVFVIFFARIIPGILLEVVFFGGIFGLLEAWRFWGTEIGLPGFDGALLIMSSAALMFWATLRIIYIIALWFPPIKIIPNTFLGR